MKYTTITNDLGLEIIIRNNEDGTISSFMSDPANADYQAYLDRDKPQVEHLTEIPTVTE